MANSKWHHEVAYRGKELIQKLSKNNLTICGAGALGSNLIDNLTRQGVSNLKVIDKDRIEVHNLSTQVWAEADVGALKVEALKTKIYRNVSTEIEAVNKELTAANVKQLLKGSNLVLDCFDNNTARQIVQNEVRTRKLPCLHCGLHGSYGEIIYDEFYRVPKDQTEGDVCDYPLARNIAMLTMIIASEEILDFFLAEKPRKMNWSVTLKDLAIKPMILPRT
jgi:molybdopterin-synthase adenylyltransferase